MLYCYYMHQYLGPEGFGGYVKEIHYPGCMAPGIIPNLVELSQKICLHKNFV